MADIARVKTMLDVMAQSKERYRWMNGSCRQTDRCRQVDRQRQIDNGQ